MKYFRILILIILFTVLLCSCGIKTNKTNALNEKEITNKYDDYNSETDDIENKFSPKLAEAKDSNIIIAWENLLLGNYNKNEKTWTSCSELNEDSITSSIIMGDVLTKSVYYVFHENKLIGKSNKVIFPSSNKYTLEDMENANLLINLGESKEEGHVFNLPVSMNDTIYNMSYSSEDLLISFEVDKKEINDPKFSAETLILSEDINIYPREYSLSDKIPQETIRKVKSLFDAYKVNNIIPYYKCCYHGDFDGDNDFEYLTVINNKLGENNEIIVSSDISTQETAFYNIIIYQDGTNVKVLKNMWNTTPETEPTLKGNDKYYSYYYWGESNYSILNKLLIADINGDNKYEFLTESYEAFIYNLEVYSILNDNYKVVLKSICSNS
ncbi:MAG: hypothetical protein N4A63_14140 [Vallitalea sp.]|jgi:hypothetical protein|nr:hypothetical protein [Vallitalea sp.]